MPKYEMYEDSGASEIIEAESLEDALEEAKEWASEGSYDERVMVGVTVIEIDENGDIVEGQRATAEVEAGPEPEPPESPCGKSDGDHDWRTPYRVVGGCRENPGVWGGSGTRLRFQYVCGKCGIYKTEHHTGAQRNSGEIPVAIEYATADERSLGWLDKRSKL